MTHGDKAKAKTGGKSSQTSAVKKSSSPTKEGGSQSAAGKGGSKGAPAGAAKAESGKISIKKAGTEKGNGAPAGKKAAAASPPKAQPKPAAPSPTPPSPTPSSTPSRSTPTLSASSPTDAGVRYLTVQDVVDLHRAVCAEFGGNQAHPGVVESQFGLMNAVQRPQITTLGREAYPTFSDKAAAFVFALLQARPFRGGNRRVALASLLAFCELNNRNVTFDEKTAETLFRRAGGFRELGIPPENVYRELKETLTRSIV